MKKAGILCFTNNGRKQRERLVSAFSPEVDFEFPAENVDSKIFLSEKFNMLDTIIFIGATGIAVRMTAPYIKSKDVDPAVIVIDDLGKYVIPLLSGHIGGANKAALSIAEAIGAEPVITTATDISKTFAVDTWAKESGCSIMDIGQIKYVSGALLRKEKVGFNTEFEIEGNMPEGLTDGQADCGVAVDLSGKSKPFARTLNLVPEIVTIGVGCRRNTSQREFEQFIIKLLQEENIAIEAVEKVTSIDLKANEQCIIEFCRKNGLPFECFSREELQEAEGDFAPSEFVKTITGVDNVCERSAVIGSENGIKMLGKTVGTGMTAAIYMKKWKCKF